MDFKRLLKCSPQGTRRNSTAPPRVGGREQPIGSRWCGDVSLCIATPHHAAAPPAMYESAPGAPGAAGPRSFRTPPAWGGALSSVGQAQPRSGFWRGCTRRSAHPTPNPNHRRLHPRQVPDMPPVTDRGERPTPTPPPPKTPPATQPDAPPLSLSERGPARGAVDFDLETPAHPPTHTTEPSPNRARGRESPLLGPRGVLRSLAPRAAWGLARLPEFRGVLAVSPHQRSDSSSSVGS